MDISWTFEYHTVPSGDPRKTVIKAREFFAACAEFHAVTQLPKETGIDRDAYAIDRVTSSHVTVQGKTTLQTPQVYLPCDLPQRNPDAKTFTLTEALRRRIYPEAVAQEKEQGKASK